jgi:ligand-binding sensor domain-containing protein
VGDPFVYDLYIDHSHRIWAATNGGGVSYRDNSSNWHTFKMTNGLASDFVRGITEDQQGKFWFATYGGGISRLSGSTWTTYNMSVGMPSNYFLSAFCDDSNRVWIGSSNQGVMMYNGSTWQQFTTANGLAGNMVMHIMQAANGDLWFSGQGGISILSGNSWSTLTTADGLPDNLVYSTMQDTDGKLHACTPSGVGIYNGTGFAIVNTSNGLPENNVIRVFRDVLGEMWYGHENKGLTLFKANQWYYYNESSGLKTDYVEGMVMDAYDNMWFATPYGLTKFDGYNWKTLQTADGLPNNNLTCIAIDSTNNKLWMGSNSGLISYDGTNWVTYTTSSGLMNNNIRSIFFDSHNNLWVIYYNSNYGVSKLTGNTWVHYGTSQGLISNTITAIAEDHAGSLWFSSNYGISRMTSNGVITNYTTTSGLPDEYSSSITVDASGQVWAGFYHYYNGGIARFNGTSWYAFTTPLVHSPNVYGVFGDSFGNVWVGGYYNYDYKVLTYINGTNWNYVYNWQGIGQNYIERFYEDRHHNLWAAGSYGVSRTNLLELSVSELESQSLPCVLYPNPCQDMLNISLSSNTIESVLVQIFDITGRILLQQSAVVSGSNQNHIITDCSSLSNGTYVCVVTSGNKQSKTKLVILK